MTTFNYGPAQILVDRFSNSLKTNVFSQRNLVNSVKNLFVQRYSSCSPDKVEEVKEALSADAQFNVHTRTPL